MVKLSRCSSPLSRFHNVAHAHLDPVVGHHSIDLRRNGFLVHRLALHQASQFNCRLVLEMGGVLGRVDRHNLLLLVPITVVPDPFYVRL